MERRRSWIAGGTLADAAIAGGAGGAFAPGAADNEMPIAGGALGKATAAAITHSSGGLVTETEAGDAEGYCGVRIALDKSVQDGNGS